MLDHVLKLMSPLTLCQRLLLNPRLFVGSLSISVVVTEGYGWEFHGFLVSNAQFCVDGVGEIVCENSDDAPHRNADTTGQKYTIHDVFPPKPVVGVFGVKHTRYSMHGRVLEETVENFRGSLVMFV